MTGVMDSMKTYKAGDLREDMLVVPVHALEAERQELARLRADSAVVVRICELFKIGINARSVACIMANVENANGFAEKLHAIEREFFMVPGEPDEDFPDEEVQPDCLLNCWGHTTEQYVERFREVLPRVAIPEGFALVPVEQAKHAERYQWVRQADAAVIETLAWTADSADDFDRRVDEEIAAPKGDSHE